MGQQKSIKDYFERCINDNEDITHNDLIKLVELNRHINRNSNNLETSSDDNSDNTNE